MIFYVSDGTPEGLLSCLFKSFTEKTAPDGVFDTATQFSIGDEITEVTPDEKRAERVFEGIKKCRTENAAHDFYFAFRSGDKNKYGKIFAYFRYALESKDIDVSKNFADERVLNFKELTDRIWRETHKMKGFIRFSETESGVLYAKYEPDNDITSLLLPHFKGRLSDRPFAIHDIKRNVVGLSDGKKYAAFSYDGVATVRLSQEEKDLMKLWKTYYNSVNIKERKNEKLMRQYMPVRYWKNLPEKDV